MIKNGVTDRRIQPFIVKDVLQYASSGVWLYTWWQNECVDQKGSKSLKNGPKMAWFGLVLFVHSLVVILCNSWQS